MCLIRSTVIICIQLNVDVVDFREGRSEEVMFLLKLSV